MKSFKCTTSVLLSLVKIMSKWSTLMVLARYHGYVQPAVLLPQNIGRIEHIHSATHAHTIELYICVLTSKYRCKIRCTTASALGSRDGKSKTLVSKCRCGCPVITTNAATQLLTVLYRQFWSPGSTERVMGRGVGSIWCLVLLIPGLLPGCYSVGEDGHNTSNWTIYFKHKLYCQMSVVLYTAIACSPDG